MRAPNPCRVIALGAILLVTSGAADPRKEARTLAVQKAIRAGLGFKARVRLTAGGDGQAIAPQRVEAAAEATKDAVTECLLTATRRLGPVSGSLEFRIYITGDGSVDRCESEDALDPALTACLEAAVGTLQVPDAHTATRVRLTLNVDASKVGPVVEAAYRDAAQQQKLSSHQIALQWPVKDSKVTSKFGRRPDPMGNRYKFHAGVDLKAKMHQPILAAAAGTVTSAGWKTSGGGIKVILKHPSGITTSYGHMFKAAVTEGQWVEVGQVIGHAGMTGMVTWPHLHFEVALGDKKFDPMRFLGKVVDVRTLHAEAVGKKPRVKRTRR